MIPGQLGPIRRDLDWDFRAAVTFVINYDIEINSRMPGEIDTNANFVRLRNSLCDANDKAYFVLNCINNSISGLSGRDIKDGSIRLGFPDSLSTSS